MKAPQRRATAITRECPGCGVEFKARGLGRHVQACCPQMQQERTSALDAIDDLHPPANDGTFRIYTFT